MSEPLLVVEDLAVEFSTDDGVIRAVDGVSFTLEAGGTLGIVGESGSGKSVTCNAIMGLLPSPPARVARGRILFEGVDLLTASKKTLRVLRGDRLSMIFQDPMTSLNPFLTVGRQLTEVLELHRGLKRKAARHQVLEMLAEVGLPDPERRIDQHPHELSGGMRQRVMIAMALLCRPRLLIADEPTTALDVTVQAQILDLIRRLQQTEGTAVILITHDLGVVAGMAERLLVMYGGKVMERGPIRPLFGQPIHPYTHGLLASVPRLDEPEAEALQAIPGLPPVAGGLTAGCPFHPRCERASEICSGAWPAAVEGAEAQHLAWCHHPHLEGAR